MGIELVNLGSPLSGMVFVARADQFLKSDELSMM